MSIVSRNGRHGQAHDQPTVHWKFQNIPAANIIIYQRNFVASIQYIRSILIKQKFT
jgi:hypothetical protein